MFAIAQTPVKQNAADTITVLSGRLQSATLLEDRRSAILGLRSFARDYPASVASGALRGLIESLARDGEDVDTVKIVLETLLLLFSPAETSPEASEEIGFWLADEFTQHQENITLLLDLLEKNDFYSRLYSLQLLSAILSSRPERTEECIISARLGIARLVAILDDKREALRNEGLTLLTYLTPNSVDLQKVVAFENAFERVFNIIRLEGALSGGDRVVEDCLVLLGNLLRLNTSNQSFFREIGCVPTLAQLLVDFGKDKASEEPIAIWALEQQNRNLYALLAVLRLFLVPGAAEIRTNQAAFGKHGVLREVLQLAFRPSLDVKIKAEALLTCADTIRGHAELQETFAQLQVNSVVEESPVANGASLQDVPKVYVIDGLLDLALTTTLAQAFDARVAACECIKAYFHGHQTIRKHFLTRAIDGHRSGSREAANVLTTLLQPGDDYISGDAYRYWMAAVLVLHLVFDDADAKALAMSVVEGNAAEGEEEVTCIQTLAVNLIHCIQKSADERISTGYLMLLCGWLFEDHDAVNDFLGEASNVQSLVQAVLHSTRDSVIVPGLCAMLLGIVYEFSTKDSPVPRSTLYPILTSQLGRETYIDRIAKLRREPFFRDFEVLPQKAPHTPSGGTPNVFFDKIFVDFSKDNFSRLQRAIDRDPGIEVPVIANGIQKGISRELVDDLRTQVDTKDQALQKALSDLVSLDRKLGQERADHKRTKDTAALDNNRFKVINEGLQRNFDEDTKKLKAEHATSMTRLQNQLDYVKKSAEADAERLRTRTDAEVARLHRSVKEMESQLAKTNKDHVQDLQTAHEEFESKLKIQLEKCDLAEQRAKDHEQIIKSMKSRLAEADVKIKESEILRSAAQSELDDLLMVFGDMEEKALAYKKRLKALGEEVSDAEEVDGEDGDLDGDLEQEVHEDDAASVNDGVD